MPKGKHKPGWKRKIKIVAFQPTPENSGSVNSLRKKPRGEIAAYVNRAIKFYRKAGEPVKV